MLKMLKMLMVTLFVQKETVITNEVIDTLRPVFEAGAHTVEMKTNPRLESNGVLQVVHVMLMNHVLKL